MSVNNHLTIPSLVALTGSILLVSALIDREPPVIVQAIVAVSSAEAGNPLPVRIEVDRIKHCDTVVEMTVFDSTGTRYPAGGEHYVIVGPIGYDSYITPVPIPIEAASGEGLVRFGLKWICNYTHIVWPITEFHDVDVEILPST